MVIRNNHINVIIMQNVLSRTSDKATASIQAHSKSHEAAAENYQA